MKKIFVLLMAAGLALAAAGCAGSRGSVVQTGTAVQTGAAAGAPKTAEAPAPAAAAPAIPFLPEGGYTGRGLSDREIALWWENYHVQFIQQTVRSGKVDYWFVGGIGFSVIFDPVDKGRILRWKEGRSGSVERFVIVDVGLIDPLEVSKLPGKEVRTIPAVYTIPENGQSSSGIIIPVAGILGLDRIKEDLQEGANRYARIKAEGIPVRVTSVAKELFINYEHVFHNPYEPKTIDIGENIAIEKGASAYIDSFIDVYNGGGKKAGSYSYSGSAWKMTLVF